MKRSEAKPASPQHGKAKPGSAQSFTSHQTAAAAVGSATTGWTRNVRAVSATARRLSCDCKCHTLEMAKSPTADVRRRVKSQRSPPPSKWRHVLDVVSCTLRRWMLASKSGGAVRPAQKTAASSWRTTSRPGRERRDETFFSLSKSPSL